jgi:hypothetical protein
MCLQMQVTLLLLEMESISNSEKRNIRFIVLYHMTGLPYLMLGIFS